MFRSAVSALALALISTPLAFAHGVALPLAQTQAEQPEIKSTDLGDGVHMLVGRGGNIGLLTGEDGVFVIDSQFLNIAPANLAKIEEISGGAPKFLVNTHWHGDHTGGNQAFGATIIAHDNVRARVSTDQTLRLAGQERNTPASPKAAWPVITFTEGLSLHLNGQTVSVFHTPNAHTDGDAMVYLKEANVLHMGDVFFVGNFPFIDISSGGSIDGYIAGMELAYSKIDAATKVIPGHGPLATRTNIAESIEMLKGVRGAVVSAIEAGKSLEQATGDKILAPWAEKWGNGFINADIFTTLVYTDLSQKIKPKTVSGGRGF